MNKQPPIIDMSPDGSFNVSSQGGRRVPPGGFSAGAVPLSVKVGVGAALVAVLGISLTVAALAVWVISMILPALVVAGAVAWGMFKWRRWQLRRGAQGYAVQPRPFGQ